MGKKHDKNKGDDSIDALSVFIQQNKNKIRKVSEFNIARNKDGAIVLPEDDEWRDEKEWDKFYKDTKDKK
jgi:aspartyl aminopeptidase